MTNEPRSRSRRFVRRSAALAASLLVTGVGHVLIGRWKRGACLASALMLLAFSLPLTRWPGLVAFVLLFLTIQLDVLLAAMAPRPKGARLMVLLGAFVGALLVARFGMRAYYLEAFRIPSGSVAPTLQLGTSSSSQSIGPCHDAATSSTRPQTRRTSTSPNASWLSRATAWS